MAEMPAESTLRPSWKRSAGRTAHSGERGSADTTVLQPCGQKAAEPIDALWPSLLIRIGESLDLGTSIQIRNDIHVPKPTPVVWCLKLSAGAWKSVLWAFEHTVPLMIEDRTLKRDSNGFLDKRYEWIAK
jgi:hypothetical protein